MYDELQIQVRSLESLGVAADTYSSLLCPIGLQKIPEELMRKERRLINQGRCFVCPGRQHCKILLEKESALQKLQQTHTLICDSSSAKENCGNDLNHRNEISDREPSCRDDKGT
ncbi:hypothetical protein AVEN_167331-1 [Araneus ventricosus]|uniref:Uncharacterized protein n=1 Tax=Araneus ventricosus TaxID=182803 RepID=A0A4Y2DC07_ARAVE|nr:hypothetical protein AVEN_167331-1 [Araneus ventricosus]